MAEQTRREFREGEDIEYMRNPDSRNIEWIPGRISSFVKYIIRNNQTGRTSERVHENVSRVPFPGIAYHTRIGDTVIVSGRGQPDFEGTVVDKIFNTAVSRDNDSQYFIERSSYEIRRPGEEAMQRPARQQRQAPQAQAPQAQAPQAQAPQAQAPQQVEEDYTVGENIEVQNYGNDDWYPGIIERVGGYAVRTNTSGRIIDRTKNKVRDPISHQTGEVINLRVGSQVEIKMSNNTWVPGILLKKYYIVSLAGRALVNFAHTDIRRPQGQAVAPAPQAQEPVAPAQEPAPQAQEPAPAVNIFETLDRETQEQLRLEQERWEQDRREFQARNGERYTVGERVEARLPGATINNNWRPATITRVGRLVVRNNSSTREMDRQESGVRDPATQQTGETANLRVSYPVEIQMLRNRWVPGILISKNYSVQFDGADNIVPLTSEDIRRPQGQAPAPQAQAVAQAPQAQAVAPAPQVPQAPQQVEEDYTVGERVEAQNHTHNNWYLGTIDRIGGYEVRYNANGRIRDKQRNEVRDPTSHRTGELTNLRVGSPVEIKVSDMTWVPGTLLKKYYTVRLDVGAPIMASHTELRRPGNAPVEALAPAPAVAQAQPRAEQRLQHFRDDEQIEYLLNGEWVPGIINRFVGYVVRDNQTGITPERTFLTLSLPNGAVARPETLRVGNVVTYNIRGDNFQGTVIDKKYQIVVRVGGENGHNTYYERGIFEIRRPGEEVLERPQEQAQPVVRPPPPQPAVRPPLPQPTEAVAFEIHNAFDSFKFDKFMDIVRKNSNFKNRNAPLKPLIDNVNANPKLSPEKKTELSGKIERIFTTLRQYSNYDRNINNIMDCIQYVLMQPQDFINIYIDTFVTDCLKAYSTGRGDSCVKGMYERVYFAFRDTVSTICLDQIQGTGAAPLCKPEYIEIFNCFYEDMPTEMLNDYAQQWFQERGEAAGNFSEENRIEDFVSFVRSKVNNVARFRQAERSVRRYAATNINVLFGGRRRQLKKVRKTVKRRKNITMKKRGNKKTRKH
jgi:hypothetical protein